MQALIVVVTSAERSFALIVGAAAGKCNKAYVSHVPGVRDVESAGRKSEMIFLLFIVSIPVMEWCLRRRCGISPASRRGL